jgi:hypothetical protein
MTSTTNNLFVVNSDDVTFENCYLNGQGTPTTSQGVVVGTDAITITDGTCINASATFTSTAQANWTSANIGQRINLTNCATGPGPLFASIASINNSKSIQLSTTATCGGSCPAGGAATAKYGRVYLNTLLSNMQIVNFGKSFHLQDASQWRALNLYTNSLIGVHIEDQLSPDFGNGYIVNSYLLATDTASGHYPILWNSGGEIFVIGTKLLNGQYGLFHNSNIGITGGFIFEGGGVENCSTSAMFFSEAAQFNHVVVKDAYLSCGAPVLSFDNSSGAVVNNAMISAIFGGGGGTAVDCGKVNNLNLSGSVINTGGGNPAINIRSNCNGEVTGNHITGATVTISNASTTMKLDDMNGLTTANLPSSVANGSRLFLTDADPATSPCTHAGAQTGSTAFRQNGAWKCF